ncbi:MAG: preprotein translocase subunit [Planctomycetaceae bacterium]|nr:preprotein translocase subunit [Planctomycetaceae bacterium]
MPASLFHRHRNPASVHLNNPQWIGTMIEKIRKTVPSLHGNTDSELSVRSETLSETVCGGVSILDESILIPGLALMTEALRRRTGKLVYDVQLQAAMALAVGSSVEMQTGEGKTLSVGLAAYLHALQRRGVHVVTANAYLAERDCHDLGPAYEILGLTCGFLPEGNNLALKRAAYECDLTYGTGYEFGFDYLRDQVQLRNHRGRRLGEKCLSNCQRSIFSVQETTQRGLWRAIVDEADNVLLDDACSPLVLSGNTAMTAVDEQAHQLARRTAANLHCNHDFRFDHESRRVALTDVGVEAVHGCDLNSIEHVLQRPWIDYVEHALQAEWLYHRDVHYIVREAQVQLVDGTTGRVFEDRKWSAGLHQAVEAKEGVLITAESQPLAKVTRQRLYKSYQTLTGLTGTATGSESEFLDIYGLRVISVPLRVPSQRRMERPRFFVDGAARLNAVAAEVGELHRTGRPVLVGTRSIAETGELSALLKQQQVAHQVLSGVQDADETAIISAAGNPGSVTISTNMAGRGTDIQLSPRSAALGGLHVIVSGRHEASRIDRQIIGRGARQGDPGSARVYCSGDDWLVQSYGPWIRDALRRYADSRGEVAQDFSVAFDRAQRSCERQQCQIRRQLYQEDRRRTEVLVKLDSRLA